MFSSTEKETPKKHINEITNDLKTFWEPLFDHMGLASPIFGAKLGYNGKEFGEPRQECVRFFPNELANGQDYYLELFNWDQDLYHKGQRILYRHKFDPNWKSSDKYVEVIAGKLATPTYAIRISDLEVVNVSPVTAARPEVKTAAEIITGTSASDDPFDEESFTEMFSEGDDDHYSKMTIRDLYCMLQNVPLSNKSWLNKLIEQGVKFKK